MLGERNPKGRIVKNEQYTIKELVTKLAPKAIEVPRPLKRPSKVEYPKELRFFERMSKKKVAARKIELDKYLDYLGKNGKCDYREFEIDMAKDMNEHRKMLINFGTREINNLIDEDNFGKKK